MIEKLSTRSLTVLLLAQAAAQAAGFSEIRPICLIRGIAADHSAREFVRQLGPDAERVLSANSIDGAYGADHDAGGNGSQSRRGLPFREFLRYALELALKEAEHLHHPVVDPEHILLAILQLPDSTVDLDLSVIDVNAFRSVLKARQYGSSPSQGQGGSKLVDASHIEATIREMHRTAATAFGEGRIEDAASLFAQDVEYYSQVQGMVDGRGRELIVEVFRSVYAAGSLVELETVSVSVMGKIQIEHGFFQYLSRGDGTRWGERTRYCAIWKMRGRELSIVIFVRFALG